MKNRSTRHCIVTIELNETNNFFGVGDRTVDQKRRSHYTITHYRAIAYMKVSGDSDYLFLQPQQTAPVERPQAGGKNASRDPLALFAAGGGVVGQGRGWIPFAGEDGE